jgi:hypothetical protein
LSNCERAGLPHRESDCEGAIKIAPAGIGRRTSRVRRRDAFNSFVD